MNEHMAVSMGIWLLAWAYGCLLEYLVTAAWVKYPAACNGVFD